MRNSLIFKIFLLSLILFLSVASVAAENDNIISNDSDLNSLSDSNVDLGADLNLDSNVDLGTDSKTNTTTNINPVLGTTFEDIQSEINKANENDTIYLNGTYTSTGKSINITKSLNIEGIGDVCLNGNYSSEIFNIGYNTTISIKNIQFINASRSAINDLNFTYIYSKNCSHSVLNIYNCSFFDNANEFIEPEEYTGGNTICVYNVNVYDSQFKNNFGDNGGVIYGYNVSSYNCEFLFNTAIDNGGAIYGSYINIYNSLFKNNTCYSSFGGAINGDYTSVYNSSFINNRALFNYDDDVIQGFGGAIYSGNCQLFNSSFINNYALADGGAIAGESNGNSLIENCSFINNSAEKRGGAIYLYVDDNSDLDLDFFDGPVPVLGKININNSIFTNNSAIYAGAIYTPVKLYLKDTVFKNNKYATVIANRTFINSTNLNTSYSGGVVLNNNLKKMDLINITITNPSTSYQSNKKLTIKFTISGTKKVLEDLSIHFYKSGLVNQWDYTNYKGVFTYDISKFKVGTYKITLENKESYATRISIPLFKKSITVKITKAKTTLKAPKVTNKYKKSKYFTVTVKNAVTKKGVNGLKIKLKVFTGKKYKVYTVKTNKKGVYKLNTKKFKRGNHKVVISSANSNFVVIGKSSFRIK